MRDSFLVALVKVANQIPQHIQIDIVDNELLCGNHGHQAVQAHSIALEMIPCFLALQQEVLSDEIGYDCLADDLAVELAQTLRRKGEANLGEGVRLARRVQYLRHRKVHRLVQLV